MKTEYLYFIIAGILIYFLFIKKPIVQTQTIEKTIYIPSPDAGNNPEPITIQPDTKNNYDCPAIAKLLNIC